MLCEFYLKEQTPKYTPTPTLRPLNHMDAVEVASGKIKTVAGFSPWRNNMV